MYVSPKCGYISAKLQDGTFRVNQGRCEGGRGGHVKRMQYSGQKIRKGEHFENLGIIGKLLLNGVWNKYGGCRKGVDWIQPVQDKVQWWILMKTITNLCIPQKAGNFFYQLSTISFSVRLPLQEIKKVTTLTVGNNRVPSLELTVVRFLFFIIFKVSKKRYACKFTPSTEV